ncbi:hypothetical protein N0V83_009441 [Neocucurbitaria cava]|uniref:Uncharacterized protein n=1 Tax=Neocucurbitaria cava TaxID=798079 RepID=A0A9W8XZS8_9PLEO|nr:hypothetical protein N0V83_009441 [Neocucurbitaria cava]
MILRPPTTRGHLTKHMDYSKQLSLATQHLEARDEDAGEEPSRSSQDQRNLLKGSNPTSQYHPQDDGLAEYRCPDFEYRTIFRPPPPRYLPSEQKDPIISPASSATDLVLHDDLLRLYGDRRRSLQRHRENESYEAVGDHTKFERGVIELAEAKRPAGQSARHLDILGCDDINFAVRHEYTYPYLYDLMIPNPYRDHFLYNFVVQSPFNAFVGNDPYIGSQSELLTNTPHCEELIRIGHRYGVNLVVVDWACMMVSAVVNHSIRVKIYHTEVFIAMLWITYQVPRHHDDHIYGMLREQLCNHSSARSSVDGVVAGIRIDAQYKAAVEASEIVFAPASSEKEDSEEDYDEYERGLLMTTRK